VDPELTAVLAAADDAVEAAWISAGATLIAAVATVLAALIVSVTGGVIAGWFASLRDRQEKETQWRDHALELTKLDLERKLKTRKSEDTRPLRPSILDFLANYRDLCELEDRVRKGRHTPAKLYDLILKQRVAEGEKKEPDEETTPPVIR
jgi:hypothetical protein